MANRDWNYRRYKRYIKGIRRIKEDRAQHGTTTLNRKWTCDCFCDEADHGKGATFSRFADYPANCAGLCCSQKARRKAWGDDHRYASGTDMD